ncbi:hypothetical protein RchiOBHm_Chr5g0082701 [Rosa chinensis]|uniref:DUF3752 domain-containing protein n=2 Tax=Rosa chinensis TaxID=74649 RepID=A0A2P6QNC7_ROSCH|nr:hypothetical protein RchiOBHm_Chr5g0082701 [Rosa chinensis]
MKHLDYTSNHSVRSSISSPSSSDDSKCFSKTRHLHRPDDTSKRDKQRQREKAKKQRSKSEAKRMKSKDSDKKKQRAYEIDDDSGSSSGGDPQAVLRDLLKEFPNIGCDLKQLLQVIDGGKAVDINGLAQKPLIKPLRTLFLSLNLRTSSETSDQANQAVVKLNKAFKELQDPEKRRALDEKIELREMQERFIVELRAMREAAMWRKMQGISMEGDEELLAGDVSGVKAARKRDEKMTELPPERKHGMSTRQSTMFSRSAKQGRGDTSGWTDAPSERAWKAKMEYLQAYNEFASLASNEEERKRSLVAELMDNYKKDKRSKSLLQKHQEEIRAKRKYSKQQAEEEDWVGKHPWKPWDREKDLAGGRQRVKLDSKNMTRGLSSRFSGGSYQRNFL